MSIYNMYPIPDDDLPINKKEHTIDITKLFNPGYGYNTDAITNPLLKAFMGDGKSTKKERKQGKKFSNVDLMKMQWDYSQAIEERQYNEYLYNQYESPAAQMRQYQSAGLNPALMYGGATGGHVASSNNAPTSTGIGNGTQETNGFDTFSRIIEMITGAIGMKNQIDATRSQIVLNQTQGVKNAADAAKSTADAKKTEKETSRYDEVTDANLALMRISAEQVSANIEKIQHEVKGIDANTVLTQAKTETETAHKGLILSQTDTENSKQVLLYYQSQLAKANAHQINAMLPFMQAYYSAETNLKNAQTDTEIERAAQVHNDAALKVIEVMKEQQLLSNGYYNELTNKMRAETKLTERRRTNETVELYLSSALKLTEIAVDGAVGMARAATGH